VLLAAFGIGLIEVFGARYIGPFYRDIVVFAVFALVLLLFPRGIGGARKARTV
jgi:branched-chain amino acid transport system permease protein